MPAALRRGGRLGSLSRLGCIAFSTRQVAGPSGLPKSLFRPLRIPPPPSPLTPRIGAYHNVRFYATEPQPQPPPPPDHKKKKAHDDSGAAGRSNGKAGPRIPDGWTRLEDEDIELIRRISDNVPTVKKDLEIFVATAKEIGIPMEVKSLIQNMHNKPPLPVLSSLINLTKGFWKMANELRQREKDRLDSRVDAREDSKPGDTRAEHAGDKGEAQTDTGTEQPSAPPPPDKQHGDTGGIRAQEEGQHSRHPERSGRRAEQSEPEEDQEKNKARDEKKGSQNESRNKSGGPGGGGGGGKDDWGGLRTFANRISFTDIFIAFVVYMMIGSLLSPEKELTWQEVRRNFLEKGLVERFTVHRNQVDVVLSEEASKLSDGSARMGVRYYFSIGSVESFERHLEEAQQELGIPPSEYIPVSYAEPSGLWQLIIAFGPTLLFVGLLSWGSRSLGVRGGNSGIFNMGKNKAKIYSESDVRVRFSDVAGMEEAKVEIMEFVSFLKQPERFEKLGAKIPRGAILSGPPGTGKTLLAKATAGESGVPFYSVSGSEFVEMFVGVGASRVRDLFSSARKNAPCIIFIDEIDAIGRSRGSDKRFSGNDEREATLNQILTEMDGFNTSEQVVVLAGTNRADILDKALMRPGRFDRHIYIDRPTMQGRRDIFNVYLKKIVTNEDLSFLTGRLASLTPGFSGADVANVVNEAALIAARANASSVTIKHFEQAIERVVGGLERKSLVLKPDEKKVVAYHEAGHAICGWFLEFADPLLKVSIIPRGQGALGYAQYLPGDQYLLNVNQLMDRMAMTLGGRISEELHFPTVTTGGSDDFKKVTQMARRMVTQWGMSEKVGPIHYDNDENQFQKPFAEATAQDIDAEVHRIVDTAYKRCKDLLTERKKEVGMIAEELLRKEVLLREDMVRLLGQRQWGNDAEFEKYFRPGQDISPPPFPEETDSPPPPSMPGPEGTPPPSPPPSPAPATSRLNGGEVGANR